MRDKMARKRSKKTERAIKLGEWSKQVRERDGWRCVICGREDHTQAHHILEKKLYPEHMLNIDVGITVCPKHHMFGKESAHHGSFFFYNWLQENRPEQFAKVKALLKESIS